MINRAALLLLLATQGGAPPRRVDIAAADRVPLHATYFAAERAGPGVVIFRNCDNERSALDAFGERLRALGIHTVTWDYRPGVAQNLDWSTTRLRDAQAVAAWLQQQPGVDSTRMVAIGGSCGVSLALDFAMHRRAPLRGVVILSGPSEPEHLAFVARTPSLAVFGGASTLEGAAVSYVDTVVRASRNPASRLLELPDAGHGTLMLTQTAAFGDSAVAWIRARLH